ncbi:hypothetical protein A9986_07215 [Solibacillus silvestris]|nr:hypothetical protein A9986_07215 [Solibacillus silvestris]
MLIALLIFVCVVSVQYIIKMQNSEEEETIIEAKASMTQEQLKTHTMLMMTEIVLKQFVENIMLNIEIVPVDDKQNVIVSLRASEFLKESTLLKDSYNLLKEIQHVEEINDITLKWFMPVKNNNTELLTVTFDDEALAAINEISYKDIPQAATQYIKHEHLD